jgi:hypothetical protein
MIVGTRVEQEIDDWQTWLIGLKLNASCSTEANGFPQGRISFAAEQTLFYSLRSTLQLSAAGKKKGKKSVGPITTGLSVHSPNLLGGATLSLRTACADERIPV